MLSQTIRSIDDDHQMAAKRNSHDTYYKQIYSTENFRYTEHGSHPKVGMKQFYHVVILCTLALVGCQKKPTLNGYVRAQTTMLSVPMPGELVSLAVDEGQTVPPHTLLAQIDATPLTYAMHADQAMYRAQQAALANMQYGKRPAYLKMLAAQKARAAEQYTLAEKTYQRHLKLYQQKSISPQDFDQAKSQYQQSQAALRAAQYALDYAKLPARRRQLEAQQQQVASAHAKLQHSIWQQQQQTVTAQDTVTVLNIFYRPHEYVAPNAPIMEVLRPADREIVFYGAPEQVKRIQQQGFVWVHCADCEAWEKAKLKTIGATQAYMPQFLFSGQPPGLSTQEIQVFLPQPSMFHWHPGQPVDIQIEH